MIKTIVAALAISAVALTTFGSAATTAAPAHHAQTSKGKAWVDANGMTLYTFGKDKVGKSNCTGECATAWPPLLVAADGVASGDWTIVVRDDGSKQWAYDGKPLYTWVKDKKPGDATGDGVDGFHLAK